ncbi:UDP-GalNAc:beta-1,3-N-acetylgalactosaminyltransferase 2-like [Oscarella lobularis]|uniref:UDP-GalNAc:beta-1, 3-N-acetylgalactosaminyltransferase 2-like n=1 Tax=Oscarella lobularis TaxID=121494 RepID=UPI0033142CAC
MRSSLLCAALIAICIELRYREHECCSRSAKPPYQLVIGIPSARSNFALRRALRETWVGAIRNSHRLAEKILVKFVVGSIPCRVHPLLRHTPYVCRQTDLEYPIFKEDILTHHHNASTVTRLITTPDPVGIDFMANFPLVLKGLGLFDQFGDGFSSNLSVTLYDTTTENEIVRLNFTLDDPGRIVNGYRFKPLTTFLIIPEGFQATLAAEGFSSKDPCVLLARNNSDTNTRGIVSFSKIFRFSSNNAGFPDIEQTLLTEHSLGAAALLFEPQIENQTSVEFPLKQDDNEKWLRQLEDERVLLDEEVSTEGDIILVDVVDVYRNITLKMLRFYEWVSQHVEFSLLLKTDDDTFLNIEEVMKTLDLYHMGALTNIWWGNFRTHWGVEKFGKWAEFDYKAPFYPAFACGSGYVLSSDIVKWIGSNAHRLKPYQGEDVSMGIWLAAVSPTIIEERDSRWQCFNTCTSTMLTTPEHSPEKLHVLWTNNIDCRNPCTCAETKTTIKN